jgi:hypothetical protein
MAGDRQDLSASILNRPVFVLEAVFLQFDIRILALKELGQNLSGGPKQWLTFRMDGDKLY